MSMSTVTFTDYIRSNIKKNKVIVKATILLAPLAVGLVSSLLTKDMMKEYANLNKPPLSPPAILFPIVWTILYLFMGVGAMYIYSSNKDRESKNVALTYFVTQLVFNFFWPIIFFNYKDYAFAFMWLAILWLLVFLMLKEYRQLNTLAYRLNIPYLLWLSFAGYLNLVMIFIKQPI